MKILLIYPPTSDNIMPPICIGILSGYLKSLGYETVAMDLNAEWQNYILSNEDFLKKAEKAYKHLETRVLRQNNSINNIEKEEQYCFQFIKEKEKLIKASFDFLLKNSKKFREIFCNKKYFYNHKMLNKTISAVNTLLSIYNEFLILYNATGNEKYNLFNFFYQNTLKTITSINPDFVGISVVYSTQVNMGIYIAKILKQQTKAHICFGGNFYYYCQKLRIELNSSFFLNNADSILLDKNEESIKTVIKSIEKNLNLKNVPNILYINEDNTVCHNKILSNKTVSLPMPCYDGIDMSKYFTPELTMPIEISRSCYWNKCSFCGIIDGNKYIEKPVAQIITEIKGNQQKYKVNKFHFITHMIHPKLADKLSTEIIKSNIKIFYMSYIKFEKEFSKSLLEKMYKSGMRIGHWGLESASKRLLKDTNKGIDIKTVSKVLKASSDAGLINQVFIIFGLPTETDSDRQETISFLKENNKYINSVFVQKYYQPDCVIVKNEDDIYKEKINIIEDNSKEFLSQADFDFWLKKIYTDSYLNNAQIQLISYNTRGLLYILNKM